HLLAGQNRRPGLAPEHLPRRIPTSPLRGRPRPARVGRHPLASLHFRLLELGRHHGRDAARLLPLHRRSHRHLALPHVDRLRRFAPPCRARTLRRLPRSEKTPLGRLSRPGTPPRASPPRRLRRRSTCQTPPIRPPPPPTKNSSNSSDI